MHGFEKLRTCAREARKMHVCSPRRVFAHAHYKLGFDNAEMNSGRKVIINGMWHSWYTIKRPPFTIALIVVFFLFVFLIFCFLFHKQTELASLRTLDKSHILMV